MARLTEHSRARLALVNAGHHFLLSVLPLRHPAESRDALVAFLRHAEASSLAEAEIDAILISCLAVLDHYTHGRLPSFIAQYFTRPATSPARCIDRFKACLEEMLQQPGVGHPLVEQAIRVMQRQYKNPQLTQASVANAIGMRPSLLSTAFNAKAGMRFREYLNNIRLDRAAALLAIGNPRIKDVWVDVGYSHASNFDHDFKRHFGMTPREYRTHAPRTPTSERTLVVPIAEPSTPTQTTVDGSRVLIVDDDEGTRTTIPRVLGLAGYAVRAASTGEEGLSEARRYAPAAVLLDYRLPDMDGLACLRALRQLSTIRQPAVALFTADWDAYDNEDEVRVLNARIASKLCSPADIEALARSLIDDSPI